jgi:hypothetical protein
MSTDKLTEDLPQTEEQLANAHENRRVITEDLPQEDEDPQPGLLTEDL